ncbi:MAG TPA: hypothetical protein VFX76_00185, partial [Roseiflexaceae bacterium]|nr:hypothetical protein [Roseiflexaceae bacterium]
RLQDARAAEHALANRLHRWDCPPAAQLGEYFLGLTTPEETQLIATHIENCSSCDAEVSQLRMFLDADPVLTATSPPAPRRRPSLRELIAQLLPPPPATAPQLALRGAGAAPLTAQAEGLTIILDVQPARASGSITVTGQLMADDQDDWTGALALVYQGGALQATATLDDLGGWSCGPLPAGRSELQIAREDGRSVRLSDVDLSRR